MSAAIEGGRAYIELFTLDKKFYSGMKRAENRLRQFAVKAKQAGAVIAGIGIAGVTAFIPAIKKASEFQQVVNKFEAVFGKSSSSMRSWSDDFAKSIGVARKEVMGFLASTQDLLVPMGIEPGAAEKMSKDLTGLAYDLAAFNEGVTAADAMRDLQAAIIGSSEPMKKYGAIVDAAAVSQYLLSQSIDPATATNAEKVYARFSLSLEKTTAASGAAKDNLSTFDGQMQQFWTTVEEIQTTIGQALLPTLTELATRFNKTIEPVQEFNADNQELVLMLAELSVKAIIVGGSLYALGTAASALIGAVKGVGAVFTFATKHAAAFAAVGVAVGLAYIARNALRATEAMKGFNRELQIGNDLDDKLIDRRREETRQTIKKSHTLEGPEKQKFLNAEIAKLEKGLEGQRASAKGASKRVALHSTTQNLAAQAAGFDSPDLEEAQAELRSVRNQINETKSAIEALKMEIDISEQSPIILPVVAGPEAKKGGVANFNHFNPTQMFANRMFGGDAPGKPNETLLGITQAIAGFKSGGLAGLVGTDAMASAKRSGSAQSVGPLASNVKGSQGAANAILRNQMNQDAKKEEKDIAKNTGDMSLAFSQSLQQWTTKSNSGPTYQFGGAIL